MFAGTYCMYSHIHTCIGKIDGLIKVFEMAHDEAGHPGYVRTHERITQTMFIQRLSPRLHEYLRHCSRCRLSQIPRHHPYGSLQPILSPPEPYYTITIDFILALPVSTPERFDCLLTVTNKFTKKIALIPGREIFKAKEWALALLNRLCSPTGIYLRLSFPIETPSSYLNSRGCGLSN